MKKKAPQKASKIPDSVKISVAVILIIGSIAYGWYTLKKYNRGLDTRGMIAMTRPDDRSGPPGPGQREQSRPGERRGPDPERMQEMREQIAEELGLTEEQRAQIQALMSGERPRSREEMEQRREQMNEILTPEQQEKFREVMRERFRRMGGRMRGMMGRRMETARRVLPPDQFKILEERMEERRREFMQRRGERRDRRPRGGQPDNNSGQ